MLDLDIYYNGSKVLRISNAPPPASSKVSFEFLRKKVMVKLSGTVEKQETSYSTFRRPQCVLDVYLTDVTAETRVGHDWAPADIDAVLA